MTRDDATRIRPGDLVRFRGAVHRVVAITWDGMYPPYFRLGGMTETEPPVSYLVCGTVPTT